MGNGAPYLKQIPRSSFATATTYLAASLLGLAMVLVLPFFLDPAEYAQLSFSLALVQLVTSIAFEWIRVAVLAHAGRKQEEEIYVRRDLKVLFTAVAGVLLALAVTLGVLSTWFVTLQMPALILATALAQGAFDGRCAWARANFDDVRLSIAIFIRAALSLVLVVAVAMATRSGTCVLAIVCVSYSISNLIFRDRLSGLLALPVLDRSTSFALVRFGTMAALGTNIAMMLPVALRSVIVSVLGLSAAGGVILALDIAQRVFSTMGMALNLLHFQTLVRAIDRSSLADAIRRARSGIAIQAALFLWMVALLVGAASSIGELVGPHRYEDDFVRHLPMLALLMSILCLRQYAVDTIFIAFRRAMFIAVSPAIILVMFGSVFIGVQLGFVQRDEIYMLLVAASGIGLIFPFIFIRAFLPGVLPFKTLTASALAAMIAIAAMRGVNAAHPVLALILQAAVGSSIYLCVLGALALMQRLWWRWRGTRF